MDLPNLTEALIRQQASAKSFQRGEDYYSAGAVYSLARRGDTIQAEVEGSQYAPYQVQITFDEAGITGTFCDCPYDWGGWCKHIVAVLLSCVHEPENIEEKRPLEEILEGLGAEQLKFLLLKLVEYNPGLLDQVESQVALLSLADTPVDTPDREGAPRARKTPVDATAIRRQVRNALHSLDRMRPSEAYWHVGDVVGQVRALLDQAWGFVEGGDGDNALAILEAITDEYTRGWHNLDGSDGTTGDFFDELGPLWTEAILCADLTQAERQSWAEKLTGWGAEVEDYGIDSVFDAAQAAALLGWDYPPLLRVFQGEITNKGAWEDEAPWYADDLAVARLNALERQGRYQEYLYLAEAEGQTAPYLTMLVRLGRIDEALVYARKYLATAGDALALAQALRQSGEIEAALEVAGRGLDLDGATFQLAAWLRDAAAGAGDGELALRAGVVAFKELPDLEGYLRACELAGERWPSLQKDLLDHLAAKSWSTSTKVDIYLHEGMLDEAMGAVDRERPYYGTVERVVDAVLESHPRWAIRQCTAQAEAIMDAGKADRYHHAVEWLEKAGVAYRAAGRQGEWQTYLEALIEKHNRKYKLRPMLEGLQ